MKDQLIHDLKKHIAGEVKTGRAAGQSLQGGLWNGAAEVSAAVAVSCLNVSDIQNAVRIAAEHALPVSTLGGGHDWFRRAIASEGITLDLRNMRHTAANPAQGTLTVAGGADVKNAVDALPEGFALVTGVSTQVGLAGLALGGGYGKLNARFGLVTDNLKSANVVLADGSCVTASQEENPDLFWALRGAGKNFAVLTSAEFFIHRLAPVLSATVFVELRSARESLRNLQEILDESDDRLSVFSTFAMLPGKGFGLILEPLWTGDEATGEKYLNALSSVAGANVVKKAWLDYRLTYDDAGDRSSWPKGRGYQMDAFNLDSLTDEVTDALLDCCHRMPPGQNCIMLHDFHGQAARTDAEATAFHLRRNHFNMQVVASWQQPEEAIKGQRWLHEMQKIMLPLSASSAYPAVIGPESYHRARAFYGNALEKLTALKSKFDRQDRFNADYGLFATPARER
ncbi:FAD-binding oxidoreductase [Mixta hanseatica]|uniref:FAD-binding protein n=1 Tax=Mixta hanseatica TaxID=2872648 RepID=A0ABY4RBQ7_9GAMM|nr:FAD-binding protein [Mixta hanseatica]UQY45783.1 FAD-binding protein [Mixta hanseatica]